MNAAAFLSRFPILRIQILIALCAAPVFALADGEPVLGWLPGEGLRGFDGVARASILWDRDGPGGEPPTMVVGGDFEVAGKTLAKNIALWNGSGWEALGEGTSDDVHALAVLPNGDLVAGGSFVYAGGQVVNRIARWDGESWSPLGTGMGANAFVYALAVLPNGQLAAAGSFLAAGGAAASGIALWDGEAWSSPGSGLGGNRIGYALAALPNGDLVVAGNFNAAGGTPASNIARWDGLAWHPLDTGISGSGGRALAVYPNGDLAVAGDFTLAGGATAPNVARWDGVSWSGVGTLSYGHYLNNTIFALAVLPDESLVAGGGFWTSTGAPANYVSRWDGDAWTPLGEGTDNFVQTLLVWPNGDLVAGGSFIFADEVHAARIARWDGTGWRFFGSGFGGSYTGGVLDDVIYDFATLPDGRVIAGGAFRAAGSVEAERVAIWDGQSWSALGDGLDGDVRALELLPDGRVLAGGAFSVAGGEPAKALAVWDGVEWAPYADPMEGSSNPVVRSLRALSDGGVVVGGTFNLSSVEDGAWNVALWKDGAWHRFGAGLNGAVNALIELGDGSVVAGGDFTKSGAATINRVARWDGEAWQPMGSGMNSAVNAFALLPDGDLVAAGRFLSAGGVASRGLARWDGAAWSAFSNAGYSISSAGLLDVKVLPNHSVVIGGYLSIPGDPPGTNVALWDGEAWNALGSGAAAGLSPGVYSLEPYGNDGGFLAGGGFHAIDGRVSAHFARWGELTAGAISLPTVRATATRFGELLRVTFEADEAEIYSIQYSTDLIVWQTLLSAQRGDTEYIETDAQRLAQPRIYFRATED